MQSTMSHSTGPRLSGRPPRMGGFPVGNEIALPRPVLRITRVDPPTGRCNGNEIVFISFCEAAFEDERLGLDSVGPGRAKLDLDRVRVMFGHRLCLTTLDTHTRSRFWTLSPRVDRSESTPISLVDEQGRCISTTTPATLFHFYD